MPRGIYVRTEKHRAILRNNVHNMKEANTGKTHSIERRNKGSESLRNSPAMAAWWERNRGPELITNSYGYVMRYVGKRYRVLEHRLVMEKMLNRPMTSDESVHHKDSNRQNNDPSNLELRGRYHGRGGTKHCTTCTCGEH